MDPITSSLLSGLAILVSLVSLIRTRQTARIAAEMQQWNWRQKVGEELTEISFLLTQNELSDQREQRRIDATERQIDLIQAKDPNQPRHEDLFAAIAESRAMSLKQQTEYMAFRAILNSVWQTAKPTDDQLAELQRVRSSLRETLSRLDQNEPIQEEGLKCLSRRLG